MLFIKINFEKRFSTKVTYIENLFIIIGLVVADRYKLMTVRTRTTILNGLCKPQSNRNYLDAHAIIASLIKQTTGSPK